MTYMVIKRLDQRAIEFKLVSCHCRIMCAN